MVRQRYARTERPLFITLLLGGILRFLQASPSAHANDVVDGTFVSTDYNVRFTPPRKDWRVSSHTPYPGILLWIRHVPSTALMLFTAQTITEAQACKFPAACQQGTLAQGAACAVAETLKARGLEVSSVNVADIAWFDFNTKERFMRQAVVAFDDLVFSLVLSTESLEQRLTLSRAFDRAIKTARANDDLAHAEHLLDPLRCSGDAPETTGAPVSEGAQPTKPTSP